MSEWETTPGTEIDDKDVCCANCQHMYLPRRSDYSQGGCESTWVEGYVCLAFGDEGIAIWMVGCDEHTAHCECFCKRKCKVPILSRYSESLEQKND